MKRILKKYMATFLSLTLLLATAPITASATDVAPVATLSVTGVDDANTGALVPGQQVQVELNITGLDIYWTSYQFQLNYDADMFDLDLTTSGSSTYFDEEGACADIYGLFKMLPTVSYSDGILKINGASNGLSDCYYAGYLLASDTTDTYFDEITAFTVTFTVKDTATAGDADFSIALYEDDSSQMFYQIGKIENEETTTFRTSTGAMSASVTIVEPGVTLSDSEVTVEGGDTYQTVQATAIGDDGNNITTTSGWSISNADTDADTEATIGGGTGLISIPSNAKDASYTVSHSGVSTTATLTVTRAASEVTSIKITTQPTAMTVPVDGAEANTQTITATVYDQFDDAMTGITAEELTWQLCYGNNDNDGKEDEEATVTGISVATDSVTDGVLSGVITVTNDAKSTIKNTTGTKFNVAVSYGSDPIRKAACTENFTVARETAEATSIEIYKDGDAVTTADTITIPTSDTANTATYTAKVLDQYGSEMNVDATLEFATATDYVTYDNGTVSVTKDADEGTFTLTASYGSLDAKLTISVKDIAITWPTVTEDEDKLVYGYTWAEMLSLTGGSASLNGTNVTGSFSIKDSDTIPNAGENVTYTLVFESTDKAYYVTTTGSVTIAQSTASITPDEDSTAISATYGDTIDLKVEIEATRTAAAGSADANTVTFYYGDKLLGTDDSIEEGVASISYDTYNDNLKIGDNTITVYYGGSDNLAANSISTITVTLGQKALPTATFSSDASYVYTAAAIIPDASVSDLTADTDYTVSYSNNTNVGTATITVEGTGYYTGTQTQTFAITTAPVTITPDASQSKTYGETDPTLTYTTDLTTGSALETAFKSAVTGALSRATGEDVGSYAIALDTLSAGTNFALTLDTTTVNFSITAKDISAENQDKTMNVVVNVGTFTDPAFADNGNTITGAIAYTDYANHAAVETALLQKTTDDTLAVDYTYTASDNYSGDITGTITFTVVDIEFTATAALTAEDTITYGDKLSDIFNYNDIAYTAKVDTTPITGTYTLYVDSTAYDADTILTAGDHSYTLEFNATDDSGYENVTVTSGDITVDQLTATLVWENTALTYTGESQAPTATVSNALSGDAVTVTVTGGKTEVGTYTATADALTGDAAANYALPETYTTSYTIAQADSDITSSTSSVSATYGETIELKATIAIRSSSDISVDTNYVAFYCGETLLGSTTVDAAGGTVSINYNTTNRGLAIDENTVTVYYGGSTNLNSTYVDAITVTLSERAISTATVTAIGDEDYTGSAITPTVTVTDVTVTDGSALTLDTDYTVAYSNNTNAGTATVTITGKGYYTGTVTENFTISKVDHAGETATSSAKYGTTGSLDISAWSKLDGVVFDSLSAVDSTDGILVADSYEISGDKLVYELKDDSGLVDSTATITIPVTSSTNYNAFDIVVTVTVLAKYVPVLDVDNISKTYDGKTITGDDISGTATYGEDTLTGAWTFAEDATYTAVADSVASVEVTFAPDDTDNYVSTTAYISVTISQATITITADNQSAYNGADEPTYTYTVTGLASGESLDSTPTSVDGVDVDMTTDGTYTIQVSQDATASVNYNDIVYVDGTLTVSTASGGNYKPSTTTSTTTSSSSSSSTSSTSVDTSTNDDDSVTATVDTSSTTSSGVTSTSVSEDTMTDAVDAAVDAADGEDISVEITVDTKSSTTSVEVEISAEALEVLVDSGVASLAITSDVATVTIPEAALAEVLSASNGSEITVAVADASTNLNANQEAKVGDAPVYDISILSDGDKITAFGGESIVITLPYTLKDGEPADTLVVWHIDDDGVITPMYTVYDEATETVSFVTTHLSVYAIVNDTNVFEDVDPNAYYYDAVLWAVENGVTGGTSDTAFSPASTCTRAQAVTFLWRAAGEPASTIANPFTDLVEGAYYYEAVLWAVENGITAGTTSTTFSPYDSCTRGQIVTFMWRMAGEPSVYGEGMSDVASGAYYYNAVNWAVDQGITTGYADGSFGPSILCNRGAIVTFLYRYLG